jgi:hypothetical protein
MKVRKASWESQRTRLEVDTLEKIFVSSGSLDVPSTSAKDSDVPGY